MLLMRVRARARARGGGGGGKGGVAKAGERETERRRGQRHGKDKTVPRFKVSCFGGRGPARAARPEIQGYQLLQGKLHGPSENGPLTFFKGV